MCANNVLMRAKQGKWEDRAMVSRLLPLHAALYDGSLEVAQELVKAGHNIKVCCCVLLRPSAATFCCDLLLQPRGDHDQSHYCCRAW
jgi:hypothetical protein